MPEWRDTRTGQLLSSTVRGTACIFFLSDSDTDRDRATHLAPSARTESPVHRHCLPPRPPPVQARWPSILEIPWPICGDAVPRPPRHPPERAPATRDRMPATSCLIARATEKHLEGLALVFLGGVLLRIATQMNTLPRCPWRRDAPSRRRPAPAASPFSTGA